MYQLTIVVGNVGKDAEMRYAPSGEAVTNFSVATNKKYTNKAGIEVKETIWFHVTTWSKLAETCNQYVKKGNVVLIEGTLKADADGNPRIWNDTTTGAARSSFDLTANNVRFLPSGSDTSNGHAAATPLPQWGPNDPNAVPGGFVNSAPQVPVQPQYVQPQPQYPQPQAQPQQQFVQQQPQQQPTQQQAVQQPQPQFVQQPAPQPQQFAPQPQQPQGPMSWGA